MPRKDTSGPAFPTGAGGAPYAPGMTLRDYFAAKAMQAMLRNLPPHSVDEPYVTWADDAYDIADAMLKMRVK